MQQLALNLYHTIYPKLQELGYKFIESKAPAFRHSKTIEKYNLRIIFNYDSGFGSESDLIIDAFSPSKYLQEDSSKTVINYNRHESSEFKDGPWVVAVKKIIEELETWIRVEEKRLQKIEDEKDAKEKQFIQDWQVYSDCFFGKDKR